jgi:peptidoglycan hydrolase-like protein with peptidoglycan-binding domain
MTTNQRHGGLRRRGWAALGALSAVIAIGVVVASPTAASAATTAEIKLAQTSLNGLAYNAGTVDGVSGPQTGTAVQAYQSDRCLAMDGAIGPQTLGKLDASVKAVQAAVSVTASGQYDAATKTAVKAYQSAHSLPADGLAGASTMAAMGIARIDPTCHTATGMAATVLQIAKGELGTLETAGNCVGNKPYSICDEWCAEFSTWVWRSAGSDIPELDYVPDVYDWGVAHGKWTTTLSTAKPGDQIIFGSADNRYHIGIVDTVLGSTVNVLSGNNVNLVNPSQQGVFERAYPLSSSVFYGLVHL